MIVIFRPKTTHVALRSIKDQDLQWPTLLYWAQALRCYTTYAPVIWPSDQLTRDPQCLVPKQGWYSFYCPWRDESLNEPHTVWSRTHNLLHCTQMIWQLRHWDSFLKPQPLNNCNWVKIQSIHTWTQFEFNSRFESQLL